MYQLVVNDHKNVTRLQEFMGTINSWLRRSLVTRYISDMTALQMNLGCDVQTYRLANFLHIRNVNGSYHVFKYLFPRNHECE